MQNLTADLITADPLKELGAVRRLLRMLAENAPQAMPGRWGTTEPLDREWSDDVADDRLSGESLHFESKVPGAATMFIAPPVGPLNSMGFAQVTADDEIVDPPLLISFVKNAAQIFEAQYAHVHLLVEKDASRRPRPQRGYVGYSDEQGEYNLMVIEQRLRSSMLELWWGTVLGPEYVSLIGAEAIESAPAFLVERLGQDRYWLQLTEDPRDNLVEHEHLAKVRQGIKKHLGEDLFWSPNRIQFRAPKLVDPAKHSWK